MALVGLAGEISDKSELVGETPEKFSLVSLDIFAEPTVTEAGTGIFQFMPDQMNRVRCSTAS